MSITRAEVAHPARRARQALQLRVEERDVERGVVNDQLRAADELDQLVDDVREARLLREEFVGDAVHLLRGAVDLAVGTQVAMERAAGLAAIHQLDAADFDDAMSLLRLQARGFGVEDDLAHDVGSSTAARSACTTLRLLSLRSGRDASAG